MIGGVSAYPFGKGITATSVTYAQLDALITAGGLRPGRWYRITDYQTIYTQPVTTTQKTGDTEVLWIMALTSTETAMQVWSESWPEDIIHYDPAGISTYKGNIDGTSKGTILYRENTRRKLSAWFDWRNIQFVRWESSAGSGIYSSVTDPGGGAASAEYYAFGSQAGNCHNCHIGQISQTAVGALGAPADYLNNIVFGASCTDCNISDDNWNCTFGANTVSFLVKGVGNTLSLMWAALQVGAVIGNQNTIILLANKLQYTNIGDVNNISGAGDLENCEIEHNNTIVLSGNISTTTVGVLNSITINSGGSITSCDFGKGNTISVQNSFALCAIDCNRTIDFPNIAISQKVLIGDRSTFEDTIDITGATSIDLSGTNYRAICGYIELESTNATETLDNITNGTENLRVRFQCAVSLTTTFNDKTVSAGNIDNDSGANFAVNGTHQDAIYYERNGGEFRYITSKIR